MQCVLPPRIASIRFSPLMAGHPDPGCALVAGEAGVAEIAAAGALQQVAAHRAHVAHLRRGRQQQGLADDGEAFAHDRMRGDVAHAGHRFQAQAAVFRDDAGEWQGFEIDQPIGRLDVVFHQLHQVGAAGDVFCAVGSGGGCAQPRRWPDARVGRTACDQAPCAASRTAATMLG